MQSVAPTWTERKLLMGVLLVVGVVSAGCLLMAITNIYKYLYQEKRWRIFLLSIFYACVFCILNARIMYSVALIRLYSV
jgi:hypothetical protein